LQINGNLCENRSRADSGLKWYEVETTGRPAGVEPPRGNYPARVDEKGRLKLPAVVHQYLNQLGEEKVFITSLDLRTARIYPISVWKQNEDLFELASDDPQAAEDIAFIANHLGADTEVDGQGRVLMPQELRQALKMENQPVWLACYKGRINVYAKDVYEERRVRAMTNLEQKLVTLEKRGLK